MNKFSSYIFVLVIFLSSFGLSSILINKTMARVGDAVVTQRHVQISQFIDRFLDTYSAKKNMQEVDLQESLKSVDVGPDKPIELAFEIALALEASNFQVVQVDTVDLDEIISSLKKQYMRNKEWTNLGVVDEELKTFVARKLKVKKFLKYKINSLTSILTEGDLKSYYEKNPSKFTNIEYEKVKENIRSYLSQQKNEEQLKSWFEVLQKKYKIQIF